MPETMRIPSIRSREISDDAAANRDEIMPRIEQVLQQIPEDQRHLRFSFSCREAGYVARAMLMLPTGTLLARTASPVADHKAAIDQVVEKLTLEIRRHKEQMWGDLMDERRRRRARDFAGARPHLKAMRDEDDREGFLDVLRPLLRELRSLVRRELILAQLEEHVQPVEIGADGLLDELMVRAWNRWNDRPDNVPVEHWLTQLLHETVDDRRCTARDARHVEFHFDLPRDDSLSRDDVLPTDESPDPPRDIEAEEERQMILHELNRFPRIQRRAFALYTLEGWTDAEIAGAQSRSDADVRRDIDGVRRALRERLTDGSKS